MTGFVVMLVENWRRRQRGGELGARTDAAISAQCSPRTFYFLIMLTSYRIWTRNGRFSTSTIVECVDDGEAVDKATMQAADGFDVEIWDDKRFVARLIGSQRNE